MVEKLQSVTHALRALKLLRRNPRVRVRDVSEELGVGASTAHRLLSTLVAEGFVRQGMDRKYELGSEMLGSASAIEHCAEVAAPVMRRLRDVSGETVHLAIVRGRETFFLSAVESHAAVRVMTRAGERPLAHGTAAGKVLLAGLDREAFDELYPSAELETATGYTIEDREDLWEEFGRVAAAGYATNRAESETDMCAIAVALRRPYDPPVCSLSLAAPLSRINPTRQEEMTEEESRLLRHLQQAATEVEGMLAY